MKYQIFTRKSLKDDKKSPTGLSPTNGRPKTLRILTSEFEAIRYCRRWNNENDPGRYNIRADYKKKK